MELINATRMVAGYKLGLEPSGRELLVVVIEGTFVLPKPGEQVLLHDEQLPLNVLLVGHARAPEGRQVTRLRAGLRVGPMGKAFDGVGERVWQAGLIGITASAPPPFTETPISYDWAFGGVDRSSEDESEHDAYLPNPVGRGWHKRLKIAWVDGKPLPIPEELGNAVGFPSVTCRLMAMGPLARDWPQRARLAVTYDQ